MPRMTWLGRRCRVRERRVTDERPRPPAQVSTAGASEKERLGSGEGRAGAGQTAFRKRSPPTMSVTKVVGFSKLKLTFQGAVSGWLWEQIAEGE